jgi:hypothetical protein
VKAAGKMGVAADWAQFPAHLERSLRGLVVESQERLAVGQHWALRWQGQAFLLEAHIFRRDEVDPLSPSRIGGARSNEKIGELLVEFDFKPDLLWQFKNVTLHLRPLAESTEPTGRGRMLQLAKAAQAFLQASIVSDLDAVTPRLEFSVPEDKTLLLGTPLRLAYRTLNAGPEECHFELRNDGFKDVRHFGSELIATPERVGAVRLWLSLQNTRNLLRSPFTELTFQCERERGRAALKVQAHRLKDARIEDGPPVRLQLDTDQHSHECTEVFVILLDEHRSVAIQFGGPRYSSAPPSIAMRLQKALLLDGSSAPVPLTPSELHFERRSFSELRGTLSLAAQDWEFVSVAANSPSDNPWLEELRRRGLVQ